ncbi:MAG: mandelate racemase/muconate lactonizing enzyme family protein [Acidobacteria bacterium]|nr:mandelate racemase/muconate lactonizing enzyme family protein [Acidobacteriota bacterium]
MRYADRSMQVSSITAHVLRAPLEEPFAFSQFSYTHREAMLVEVRTDDGLVGWGEAYGPARLTGTIVHEFLGPLLLGQDPRDVEANWELLYARSVDYGQKGVMLAAISALDIACWDIKSRAVGQPLYRMLGGSHADSIQCYATGFYFPQSEPVERRFEREARRFVADGFRAMKIKVGLGVERDVELVQRVRGVVGPAVKLMIDANHAYTPTEAIALGRKLEDADLWWFEEPVSCIDVDAYLEVKSRINIPLAGGECESTRFGFKPWLQRRAFDYCQPDICACGGVSEGMKIAALASLTGIHVTPHAWGSAIGQAAALHFYAARPRQPFTLTPDRKLIECDCSENPLRTSIVREPIAFVDGDWKLPTTAGLGVEVLPEALEQYRAG